MLLRKMNIQNEEVHYHSINQYKLYTMRWLMLCLFVICAISSLMQWVQYSIISDVLVQYYEITYEAANWTCMIYLLVYIPFVFLGNYVFSKYSLRTAVLLGALGSCVGAWIKVASVARDRFWVLLLGQSIVGSFQIFILPTSTPLAAEWFGPNEVSTACSIGVAGVQFGAGLGFIFPPLLVKNGSTLEEIEAGLYIMALIVAGICSACLLLLFIFFKDKPPMPPSYARLRALQCENTSFHLQSIKNILQNRSYVILMIVYGIDIGIFYALSVLLNEIILRHYPDGAKDAGIIGLLIVVAGILASIGYGILLDKFKIYKEAILSTQCFCCVAMIMFTFLLNQGMWLAYVTSILIGTFMTGVMPVGFEVAAELTYPEPEGTTSGFLNASAQVFGIAITYLYSFLFYKTSDIWANSLLSILFLIGSILTVISPYELKRLAVNSKGNVDSMIFSDNIA